MKLQWLTRDLPIKVFSLLLALVLYFFVSVEGDRSIDVDFPIEYKTADDITLTGEIPQSIHVTLAGPWASLRTYEGNELPSVSVDLTGLGPGQVRHRIDERDIQAPGGMEVVSVRPSELELTLDRKVERHVPVQGDAGTEQPAFGFEIVSTEVDPKRVRVVGPAAMVQQLEQVYTRPLDVAGKAETFSTDVELRPLQPPLRLRDKRVEVTVEIREVFVTRTLSARVQVRDEDAASRVEISPNPVKVDLRGPLRVIDGFDKNALVAYVDPEPELEQGLRDYEKTVELEGQPERTSLTGPAPTVRVHVAKSGKRKGK